MDGQKRGQRQGIDRQAVQREEKESCLRDVVPPQTDICSDLKVNFGIWVFYFPSCLIIITEPKM